MRIIPEQWKIERKLQHWQAETLLQVQQGNQRYLVRTIPDHSEDKGALDRYRYEISLLADFQGEWFLHPISCELHAEQLYLCYRQAEGTPLSNYLKDTQLSLSAVLRVILNLTKALEQVHQHKLVFLNLHPCSIWVDPQSLNVRLFDFSQALHYNSDLKKYRLPDSVDGLAYISPEQTGRTNLWLDYRSDFYALGVLFYRILTGVPPFHDNDANHLIYQHLAALPEPPSHYNPDLPQVIDTIVLKLLEKSPEQRYQSHSGLQADLHHCLHELNHDNQIPTFEVAHNDLSTRFNLSQQLYGREQEMTLLMQQFEHVSKGDSKLVLVSGYSGIGKSRVITEMYKPVRANNGLFVSGKFEQYKRDIPYSALIQALSTLTTHVLAQTGERFTKWQQHLHQCLHEHADVVTDLIPETELIIGLQAPPPELSPVETENRIHRAFAAFLQAFAGKEHPLVIFLDDLQWADSASLYLLQTMLSASGKYMMVIGAYRDTEIDSAHPVQRMISTLQEQQCPPVRLQLQPLEQASVVDFVADSLQRKNSDEDLQQLATLLYEKTLGNPFFLSRYLTQLHEDNIIHIDPAQGCWHWNEQQIRSRSLASNVVDLMSSKLERYATKLQRLLMMAAHLGTRFDIETLSEVTSLSIIDCLQSLEPVLSDGLLLTCNDNYKFLSNPSVLAKAEFRFLHDRIQEAAHNLIAEEDIADLRLHIARTLLKLYEANDKSPRHKDQLFEIGEHINCSHQLIHEPQERLKFAELNLHLGLTAKRSSAYLPACQYLEAAYELLQCNGLKTQPSLAIKLCRELAECSYLCGDFARADALYPLLSTLVSKPIDQISYLSVQANQYQLQGRFHEALAVIQRGIALVGIEFPNDKSQQQQMLDDEYAQLEQSYHALSNADIIAQNDMDDPLLIAAMELLRVQWYASYLVGEVVLNSLISLTMSRLSLQCGNCDMTAFGYVTSALVAGLVKGNPTFARSLGELSLSLADNRDHKGIRGTTYLLYTTFTHHWHHPVQTSEHFFSTAWDCSVEANDYVSAGYVIRSTTLLANDLERICCSFQCQQDHPVYLIGEIHRQHTAEGILQCASQIEHLSRSLSTQQVPAHEASHVLTTVTDALTQSWIKLAITELGPPPCVFSWLGFGSQARMEQGLNADQDNALLLEKEPVGAVGQYFEQLAKIVCDGLNQCGIVYCPGNIMASNPELRLSLNGWSKQFARWIQTPTPDALLKSSIFFDLRPIYGSKSLFNALKQDILARTIDRAVFLYHLSHNALKGSPPLGFFKTFTLERDGKQKKGLDLKKRGLILITDIARIYSLSKGIPAINTRQRLIQLAQQKVMDPKDSQNLLDAFDVLAQLRWDKHQHDISQGHEASNLLDPAVLSGLQRHQLKDVFEVINQAQSHLKYRFCREL